MRTPRRFPTSLPDFMRLFPDDAACAAHLEQVRWPGGFACQHGGWQGEPLRFPKRCSVVLRGRQCQRDTSLTAHTVRQGTHTPISIWFLGRIPRGEPNTRHECGAVPAAIGPEALRNRLPDFTPIPAGDGAPGSRLVRRHLPGRGRRDLGGRPDAWRGPGTAPHDAARGRSQSAQALSEPGEARSQRGPPASGWALRRTPASSSRS